MHGWSFCWWMLAWNCGGLAIGALLMDRPVVAVALALLAVGNALLFRDEERERRGQ